MKDAVSDSSNASGRVESSARVEHTQLGLYCEVAARASVVASRLGDYSYVMNDSDLIYTDVERFVSIAAHVRINPGQHPMERAGQHHFQYRSAWYGLGEDDAGFFSARRRTRVSVGPDVWIGHGAVVMGGVRIGTGAVVGAGAVVTRDVPDYTVVAGVPAQPLRERFPRGVQESLLRIAWWEWEHGRLAAALKDFRQLDAAEFCRKYDRS